MDRLGMPYITIQDINRDKKINEKRKKLGLPPTYQRHIDKFSFSHNFNKSMRYLKSLKSQFIENLQQIRKENNDNAIINKYRSL